MIECCPSKEFSAECGLCVPFMTPSVLIWEKFGGGGYAEEFACMAEVIVLSSTTWC